jgi:hypothetical protein
MPNVNHTEKVLPLLFSEKPCKELSERETKLKTLYEDLYNRMYQQPSHTDKRIVDYATEKWSISRTQAYKYVNDLKPILSNIKNAGREYWRYRFNELLLETFEKAKSEGRIKDMVSALSAMGRFNLLDQPDTDQVDWSTIQPPSFEPSPDPTLLGLDGAKTTEELNELKIKLRAKYIKNSNFIEATIIENE